VVWIIMENRSYSDVVGSSSAPYLATVARECGLATNYRSVTHPSLPNYVALTSGSTYGIDDDNAPASHPLAGPSIFSLLGSGWRSLEESMPAPCDRGSGGEYAVKHNPAAYYTDLGPSCAAQDVALGSGATPDVSARFTLLTPNLCHDMHDCSTEAGDSWLASALPQILDSATYQAGHTAVFITWDENDSGASPVPTFVLAPSVQPGTRASAPFTHYSLLRTTEELLGLQPLLGASAVASPMETAFNL
jgi:phosphatidylinositol-3-phosphatase